MVPTAQAVARQFQLTFGCTRLQEREYFCSRLQSTLQFAICVKTGMFKMKTRYFFMHKHRTFTAPVESLFDNISEGDIKGFVFKFIGAAVDLFD